MSLPYRYALVPVEWLPRFKGCRIYITPQGVGHPDWLEIIDCDQEDHGYPPGPHGYKKRAWVLHRGQVKPANLPNVASVKDIAQHECFERAHGWEWIPPIDATPPQWPLRNADYQPPTPKGRTTRPAVTPAPPSDDGALFTL